MPRCTNHNDRETNFFCVNCENYICDECRRSFENRNFCRRCYTQPILDFHHTERLPSEPYRRTITRSSESGCGELIIRGIFILLGIFAIFIGLYGLFISITGEYEVNSTRIFIFFLIGFFLVMVGIIGFKRPK